MRDQSKHNHYSIYWCRNNISRFSAMVILLGQVKSDLSCVNTSSSLLQLPDTSDGFQLTTLPHVRCLEGSYLHYDKVNGHWVRSGKVVGKYRSFMARNKEHEKESLKEASGKSLFYNTYPHHDSANYSNVIRRGFFQGLR